MNRIAPLPAAALSLAVAIAAGSAPARAEIYDLWKTEDLELDFSPYRGFELELYEPRVELRLGGRLHLDAAIFDDDRTDIDDDTEVRRGRVYLRGELFDDWSFKTEYEFAADRSGWRNLWLRYRLPRFAGVRSSVRAGNSVAPFGLEDIAASNHSTFLERALPSALAPSYQTGVRYNARGRLGDDGRYNRWTWAVSSGIEPLGVQEDDRHKSEHLGVTSRLSFAPIAKKRRIVHLAASIDWRDLDGDSRYRVRGKPEGSLAPGLLNTGRLDDVEEVTVMGFEGAAVYGPVSVQGEYMQSFLTRGNGRDDPSFDGWYVQASWIPTGESRRYSRSRGVFTGVRPDRDWGAVELAARVSHLDLFDETVRGGRATNFTAGVSWYVTRNVRLMFNYVNANVKRRSDRLEDDPQLFLFRFLVFM